MSDALVRTCPGCGQALLLLEDVEAPEEAE